MLSQRLGKKRSLTQFQIQDQQEKINLVEAQIDQEEKVIEAFQEKIVHASYLKDLTEKLSMSLSLDETIKTLSQSVGRLFQFSDARLILYLLQTNGELGLILSQKGQQQINIKSKKGDLFDQWVVKNMQPLLVEDVQNDYRFDLDRIQGDDAKQLGSLMSVPLLVWHQAWGILRLDCPHKNHFSTEDLRFLTTISDLSAVAIENARLYERLEQLAVKDDLTGLFLRRFLLTRMGEEMTRHLRLGDQLSFLMIDLDKFKNYNDQFGHIAGDIVLRAVGLLLGDFFHEPGMLVSRYGGEEFSVLLPRCTKAKAVQLAEAVRKKIAEQTLFLRREKMHITVSIGVASFPQDGQIKEDIIYKADKALYQAKQEGRNRVCAASTR
jgi:diguanylate cyclase (GGDEF)-like protein